MTSDNIQHTEKDDVEHILSSWASWHRSNKAEFMRMWWPKYVPWAKQSKTNMMAAEDDSDAAWEKYYSNMMRLVDVAIDDIRKEKEWAWYAVHKVHGLGNLAISDKYSKCNLHDLYQLSKPIVRIHVRLKGIVCDE